MWISRGALSHLCTQNTLYLETLQLQWSPSCDPFHRDILCSRSPGALTPSTQFPSPQALPPVVWPHTTTLWTGPSWWGHLVLQAFPTGIPIPFTHPCTSNQLWFPCHTCALWRVASCLPCDCRLALAQQTTDLLCHTFPREIWIPDLREGSPLSKFVFPWVLSFDTIQFSYSLELFFCHSIILYFKLHLFKSICDCISWVQTATIFFSYPVILLIVPITVPYLFVNLFLNISLFYGTISTNVFFVCVFPVLSIMPGW